MTKYLIALLLTITSAWSMNSHSTTLTQPVLNDTAVITAHSNYGGAITSLKFRGEEWVNTPLYWTGAEDHGRSIQSAVWLNELGECLNPTQAGSDPRSQLINSSWTRSNWQHLTTIYTSSQLGYWLEPGFSYQRGCGAHPEITSAQNTSTMSNVILNSNYTLGYAGVPNVLTVNNAFNMDKKYTDGVFQTVWFSDQTFDQAEYINLTTGVITPASKATEQWSPIIMYEADEQRAIGIYSKVPNMRFTWNYGHVDEFSSSHLSAYYRSFYFGKTVRAQSIVKTEVQFVFGTKLEVEATMKKLKLYNP